jgi:S1-C subfamily serine protease
MVEIPSVNDGRDNRAAPGERPGSNERPGTVEWLSSNERPTMAKWPSPNERAAGAWPDPNERAAGAWPDPKRWSSAGGLPHSRPRGQRWLYTSSALAVALAAGTAGGLALTATSEPVSHGISPKLVVAPASSSTTTSAGGTVPVGQPLDVAAIAAKVEPATVDISASGPLGADAGTGMIISSSGLVLTNNHVINDSMTLTAQINGAGKKYTATVVGADPTADVALLQLHGGTNFKTVQIGDSAHVVLGQPVVAVGNALDLPGPETVTDGVISATSRDVPVSDPVTGLQEYLKGVLQTSAPISSGNSGGPLVDASGRVIGMDTAAASSSGGANASNIGFAIPINRAMAIVRQIESGKASSTIFIGPHAIMGVTVTSVACAEGQDNCPGLGSSLFGGLPFGFSTYTAPVSDGAVIEQVETGSPAAKAGMSVGDVITTVNGKAVTSVSGLTKLLAGKKVGAKVTVGWVDQQGVHHSATLSLVRGPNV